jgi:hypothetical protein
MRRACGRTIALIADRSGERDQVDDDAIVPTWLRVAGCRADENAWSIPALRRRQASAGSPRARRAANSVGVVVRARCDAQTSRACDSDLTRDAILDLASAALSGSRAFVSGGVASDWDQPYDRQSWDASVLRNPRSTSFAFSWASSAGLSRLVKRRFAPRCAALASTSPTLAMTVTDHAVGLRRADPSGHDYDRHLTPQPEYLRLAIAGLAKSHAG